MSIVQFSDFERATDAEIKKPRFTFEAFKNAVSVTPTYDWLIDRIVPDQSFVCLVSPPSIGKSFLAIDWSGSISSGISWHGSRVTSGAVVYVSGEGKIGFNKRLVAWKEQYQAEDLPFLSLTEQRPNLLDGEGDVQALIDAIKRECEAKEMAPRVIVFDTVARCMPGGDENAGKDMGRYIDNVDRVRTALKAAAINVHHTGKDQSKGMRGHTSLLGASDTVIELARDVTGLVSAKISKQKDDEGGLKFVFRLKRVVVGQDRHGRDITSCVIVRSDEEAARIRRTPELKGAARIAYSILTQCILDLGRQAPTRQVPTGMNCVNWREWREACGRHGLVMTDDPALKEKAFANAARVLRERQIIGVSEPWVWQAH